MKIAFIHPLKHHVYYSMAGAIGEDRDVVGLFGYYYKGDLIDKILMKTKYKSLISGYKYSKIDHNVKTSVWIKTLFLLYKVNPEKFEKFYFSQFEKWVIKNLRNVDCIHVLQDYCNEVIRYAKNRGIRIVYEQIIAYDTQQFIDKKTCVDSNTKLLRQKENFDMADYILMASGFVKESIENHYRNVYSNKYHIIPYGASVEAFHYRKRHRKSDEPLKLLSVANISKRKGTDYLIEALKCFDSSKVYLTMIGLPDESGKQMVQEINKVDSVSYVGRVPHSKINEFFYSNDVFILPSLAEGSSLSVYEAIASGMPCIVTNNVGSIITHMKDGIVIPSKDTQAIVGAIDKIYNEPGLLEFMSEQTKNTIAEFTWDKYEKKIADFYRENIV